MGGEGGEIDKIECIVMHNNLILCVFVFRYSFFVAMGYLTICHISRIYIFHYGILTTDFSGPLMIVTQKITTLAFQIHDGLGRRAEDLSAEQHRLAVK